MNCKILTYEAIDRNEWSRLVQTSATGTWFQTPEAYGFYESQTEIMRPFVIAVEEPTPSPSLKGGEHHHPSLQGRNEKRLLRLRGVCVGYVTVEKSAIKQYFTRRAIILGGPVIANDCTDEEVQTLMEAVRNQFKILDFRFLILNAPIYIETRNFNDYSRWKEAFEKAGFEYKKHLNFHVDCGDEMAMWDRLSENRRRQLRRSDAEIILIENKNKENTADAEKNSENNFEVIKNAHSTSAVPDGPRGLERNHQQALTSELAAPVDANTPNLLQEEQHVECFQKCALLTKNDKNEEDIREWYEILRELYRTKVKTPLWPVEFFLEAYRQGVGKFLLVKHEGKIIGGSMVVVKEPTPNPSLKGRGQESFASVWGVHTADSTQYDLLKTNAIANRKAPTEAEAIMWRLLKGNNLSLHFRRQHIILDYIVDFICIEKGLVIELDGGYHTNPDQKEYDEQRTIHLQKLGYTELRFTNEELLVKPEEVIAKIKEVAYKLPSLQGRAGDRLSTVYEWFECGMNVEYKEQYPSVMATWAGMKYAAEHGCARYDMMGAGEPGVPYGVRDFKSEFGGEMVEHGRYLCVTKPLLYQVGKLGVWLLKRIK